MSLSTLDWIIVIAFIAIAVIIGISVKNTASKSLNNFFLGGRNLPWYVAGVSMVATTFAADTPLWVAEQVSLGGIARNWLWWSFLMGGVLTTFFFANLWRRANVLTELELLELRYGGKIASFLRGFKAVYLGLFLNCVVIGWVNAAMIAILSVFFGLEATEAFWITMGIMVLVAIYSSVAGLLGVAITDFIQFTIAMIGSVILAVIVLNSDKIGGMEGLIEKSEPWRLNFLPDITANAADGNRQYTNIAMFAFLGVTWWASWYPGNEPGGGGYISQRMMSAKDEKNAVLSSLFFQLAHYALRPWPWIIVGLAATVLYPGLEKPGEGYVYVMKDFLPNGLKGFVLAAFIGAYMSTISTQLNWGASYLTNDLYKRFIRRPVEGEDEKHYLKSARLITIILMLVCLLSTSMIDSIDAAVRFMLGSASGLGAVLIMRWYWYRINGITELVATIAPFVGFTIAYFIGESVGDEFTRNEGPLLFTTAFTTIAWILTALITKPEDDTTLKNFYQRVRPGGWWGHLVPEEDKARDRREKWYLVLCWVSAVAMIYSVLFGIGNFIFMDYSNGFICTIIALVSTVALLIGMKKSNILN